MDTDSSSDGVGTSGLSAVKDVRTSGAHFGAVVEDADAGRVRVVVSGVTAALDPSAVPDGCLKCRFGKCILPCLFGVSLLQEWEGIFRKFLFCPMITWRPHLLRLLFAAS